MEYLQPTIGFFSQDLRAVMEEAAPRVAILDKEGEPIMDEEGNPDYDWAINTNAIPGALVNATKEQQSIIEELKAEIQALKSN